MSRLERWVARRGWWWEALTVGFVVLAVSCSPQDAHADEPLPAGDTYATGESSVDLGAERVAVEVLPGIVFEGTIAELVEVQAYLEHVRATTEFLRWHQVERWRPMAACESGERWSLNGRYDGGLQFLPSTWRVMGGRDFAVYAWQAEPWQQSEVADRLVAHEQAAGRGGWGPWSSCARQLGLPR